MEKRDRPAFVTINGRTLVTTGLGLLTAYASYKTLEDPRYDPGPQRVPSAAIAAIGTASGTLEVHQIGVHSTVYGSVVFKGLPHNPATIAVGTSSAALSVDPTTWH